MVSSGEVKTVFKCLKFLVSLIIVTSASIKHTNNVTEAFPITRYYFWSKTDAALSAEKEDVWLDLPRPEGKQNSWNFGQGPKCEKHLLEERRELGSMTMEPFLAQVSTTLGDLLKVLEGI